MSEPESALARWSRRKREAALAEKDRAELDTAAPKVPASERDAQTGEKGAADAPPEPSFDPASLPPIESIVAGTDIKAFLQAGVPAGLRHAALRRAWATDPAIRDFVEMAENQWDFNDPSSIPGFGPLTEADDVQGLVARALGRLEEANESGDSASADTAEHASPAPETKEAHSPSGMTPADEHTKAALESGSGTPSGASQPPQASRV